MDVIKTQQISSRPIEKVVVHPLVLLSIVDNYNRVAKDTRKRVVGVLIGSSFKGTVDVTNSYAVPFEEDEKDPSIWFLDHNYHELMFSMFRRINAKEHVVGWYSTGPKLRENDLDIHGLFNDYVPNPVLVIIDVEPKELGIPTKAYYAVEEVKENATQKSQKVFVHVPSEIAAHEVEEIGVEHLLRDVKDTTISTLATEGCDMESPRSVNSPRRTLSLSKQRRATVSFFDPDYKTSGFGFSGDHGPKPSEVYGFVGSITTVVATVIFLVWAYVPESWLQSVGISYYPSRYWALATPTYVMVTIVLMLGFYIGLNFISTPPPASLNTVFDEFSRDPLNLECSVEENEKPIEPISDIGIDRINDIMFNSAT